MLKNLLPKDSKWTSFAINHGKHTPIHRDFNNAEGFPNSSFGLGSCSKGCLWVEGEGSLCGRKGLKPVRENSQGEILSGMEYDIHDKVATFSPKAWHGSCDWEGDRWVDGVCE